MRAGVCRLVDDVTRRVCCSSHNDRSVTVKSVSRHVVNGRINCDLTPVEVGNIVN